MGGAHPTVLHLQRPFEVAVTASDQTRDDPEPEPDDMGDPRHRGVTVELELEPNQSSSTGAAGIRGQSGMYPSTMTVRTRTQGNQAR